MGATSAAGRADRRAPTRELERGASPQEPLDQAQDLPNPVAFTPDAYYPTTIAHLLFRRHSGRIATLILNRRIAGSSLEVQREYIIYQIKFVVAHTHPIAGEAIGA
jgi:hypothetical protein